MRKQYISKQNQTPSYSVGDTVQFQKTSPNSNHHISQLVLASIGLSVLRIISSSGTSHAQKGLFSGLDSNFRRKSHVPFIRKLRLPISLAAWKCRGWKTVSEHIAQLDLPSRFFLQQSYKGFPKNRGHGGKTLPSNSS